MEETSPAPTRNGTLGRAALGRILVRSGVLTDQQLDTAIEYQVEFGCRLGEALIALNLCTDVDIARALAEQIEAPFVDLNATPPLPSLITAIPRELAMEFGVLPVRMEGSRILLAALNPSNIRIDEAIRQWTGLSVLVAVAPESQLREQLRQRYGLASFEESRGTLRGTPADLDVDQQQESVEALVAAGAEITASQIINTLVADAVRRGASDVHIEPQEHQIRVRYRVDGDLVPIVTLPRRVLSSIAARTKVACGMDLSETRRPQDGNCRVRVDGRVVDLRASTLPGVHGEIVVYRVLTRDSSLQKLEVLGLEAELLHTYRRLLSETHGMILVTGPTGSGKTTTLYASVAHRNADSVNIVTVEDPVEIRLPGINQVQVDDRAGRSFAATLRAMLRQDPDIIMVGEIRDVETAEIACRAALTGHLVLSTLHSRHALGTLARLVDMGIPRYTIAASLNGVMAQRLVRRLCEECAEVHEPAPGIRELLQERFGDLSGHQFRRGVGCRACHGTGLRGRVGVYELVVMDEQLRRLIAEGADRTQLKVHVDRCGFRSMDQDAFSKACQGLISAEEVLRLSSWSDDEEE